MDELVKVPNNYMAPYFQWDQNKTSNKLQLTNDNLQCTVKESTGFKSTLGDYAFTAGNRYYFEIKILKGTLIKVGIARPNALIEEVNLIKNAAIINKLSFKAFSDNEDGWAIYNGEVRHNSNSTGKKYGEQIQVGDVIGVMLDMIQGQVSFSRNGVNWGIAYEGEEFKQGKFYAACSPIYKQDAFQLRMFVRED